MCGSLCRIPPSPEVMRELFVAYRNSGLSDKISFRDYLASIGYTDPSGDRKGMDDGARFEHPSGPNRFTIPRRQVTGTLRVITLLVDFVDRPGMRPAAELDKLLFSRGALATGSMAEFYTEATAGKVDIVGSVHGWLRMPESYAYYVNHQSGMGNTYPHNAQRLAEDAVRAALDHQVPFSPELDCLGQGQITALFIVHAGPGGEVMQPPLDKKYIWSHKWNLEDPIDVAPGLIASVYLTVPEDCKVGVCAHELGHLAFQWDDFYDANYADDGQYWDGSGAWDLMAGGSYNGNGQRPAHPAGLHKMQHGWVKTTEVTAEASPHDIVIPPYGPQGSLVRVRCVRYLPQQYLLLENRQASGFDDGLPGPGLLVWRVDERLTNEQPRAGLVLVEADGLNNLEMPNDANEGDAGDPFPGATKCVTLGETGVSSTSFPGGGAPSGVRLSNIVQQEDGSIRLTIEVAP